MTVLDGAVNQLGDLPELRLKRAAILAGRSPLEARPVLAKLEEAPDTYTAEQKAQLLTGLAELSFTIQDYANARRLFRQLAGDRPGEVQVRLLLAEIALRANDRDAMPGLIEDIRRLQPPGGTVLPMLETRFELTLAEAGDRSASEKARNLLQTLQQQRP